jgi:hypothetical protein
VVLLQQRRAVGRGRAGVGRSGVFVVIRGRRLRWDLRGQWEHSVWTRLWRRLLVGRALSRDGRTAGDKVRVVGVDVRGLDADETGDVFGRRPESLSQQVRDHLDELRQQPREPLQLLPALAGASKTAQIPLTGLVQV